MPQQARNCVDHHERSQLTARQHIVADRRYCSSISHSMKQLIDALVAIRPPESTPARSRASRAPPLSKRRPSAPRCAPSGFRPAGPPGRTATALHGRLHFEHHAVSPSIGTIIHRSVQASAGQRTEYSGPRPLRARCARPKTPCVSASRNITGNREIPPQYACAFTATPLSRSPETSRRPCAAPSKSTCRTCRGTAGIIAFPIPRITISACAGISTKCCTGAQMHPLEDSSLHSRSNRRGKTCVVLAAVQLAAQHTDLRAAERLCPVMIGDPGQLLTVS